MKVNKTLLAAIAVAVAVSTTTSSCTKFEDSVQEANDRVLNVLNVNEEVFEPKAEPCPGCGMG